MPTKPTSQPQVNFLRPSTLIKRDRVTYSVEHNKKALETWLASIRGKGRKTNE